MLKVKLKTLSINGEDGSDVTPGIGDETDMLVTGKVTSIDGEHAMIEVTKINDEAVAGDTMPEDSEESDEDDLDSEYNSMMSAAKKQDNSLAAY